MNGTETKRRCFIFTGGKELSPALLSDIPGKDDFIIAADKGCETLQLCQKALPGLTPELVLGDMDSYSRETLAALYPSADFRPYPPEKDDTDTALAVDTALAMGYRRLVLVGGLGGRLDHTLANLYLLEYIREQGGTAVITNGYNRAYLALPHNRILPSPRRYVSLIPLDETLYGVRMTGFYYPLDVKQLYRRRFVSISNELRDTVGWIDVEKGSALITETTDGELL